MIKKNLLVLLLILIIMCSFAFSAPTSPPPAIGSETNEVSATGSESEVVNSGADIEVLPDEPESFNSGSETVAKDSTVRNTAVDSVVDDSSSFNVWIIISVILFIIIIGLSGFLFVVLNKNKFSENSKMQYVNQQDSFEYNLIHDKIKNYILQYMGTYPYDSIKTSLIKQGFKETEIDEINMEITNGV